MKEIRVKLEERSYSILVGENLLNTLTERIEELCPSKILLVTDKSLYKLYGREIEQTLMRKFKVSTFLLPSGERGKSIYWLLQLYRRAVSSLLDRFSLLICLGGGVVGDVGGFAAATYLRGIRYIQIPTTLLAMVDSSIGGKTGVDFVGKNLIGAFYQPVLVICDVRFIKTLPERTFFTGMGEVIKYGVIKNGRLIQFLREKEEAIKGREKGTLKEIVYKCAKLKAEVVEKDEKEKGLRMILNFGHTLGHGIEAASNFRIWHGEAVSLGMVGAAYLSQRMGLVDKEKVEELKEILSLYRLPTHLPSLHPSKILNFIFLDKKRRGEKLKFVLMKDFGEVIIQENIPPELIQETLVRLRKK